MPNDGQRFAFNLMEKDAYHDDNQDIIVHFNPRRHRGGQLVINDRRNARWGRPQVLYPESGNPDVFISGMVWELRMTLGMDAIAFYVDGHYLAEFEYRSEVRTGQPLFLVFGREDDHGNPDALALEWEVAAADTAAADREELQMPMQSAHHAKSLAQSIATLVVSNQQTSPTCHACRTC